jgi:hypothetical protein
MPIAVNGHVHNSMGDTCFVHEGCPGPKEMSKVPEQAESVITLVCCTSTELDESSEMFHYSVAKRM